MSEDLTLPVCEECSNTATHKIISKFIVSDHEEHLHWLCKQHFNMYTRTWNIDNITVEAT